MKVLTFLILYVIIYPTLAKVLRLSKLEPLSPILGRNGESIMSSKNKINVSKSINVALAMFYRLMSESFVPTGCFIPEVKDFQITLESKTEEYFEGEEASGWWFQRFISFHSNGKKICRMRLTSSDETLWSVDRVDFNFQKEEWGCDTFVNDSDTNGDRGWVLYTHDGRRATQVLAACESPMSDWRWRGTPIK